MAESQRSPIAPAQLKPSLYGLDPELVAGRGAMIPDMTSVLLADLFADTPAVIFPSERGISTVREAAMRSLDGVDMSMIKPEHTVNICASHHGFTLFGGQPYAEMLKVLRDVIAERTGCRRIRLRAGVGLRYREAEEYITAFGLDEHFGKRASAMCVAPVDAGIPIETEIGTLYGLRAIYDADWIVHAHNSDIREVHLHRQVDRTVKAFGMSYARLETRSTYHMNYGPRAANFIARSIFASDFVQEKFAFTTFLDVSPGGIVNVDSDNDLFALNDRLTVSGLKYYGKIFSLLGDIRECIAILDFPAPVPYVFAAGVMYSGFVGSNTDPFDLDVPLPSYSGWSESFSGKDGPLFEGMPPVNPAIKMCVQNFAWGGYPSACFAHNVPTVVVGEGQAEIMNRDPQSIEYMSHSLIADSLEAAITFARKTTGTDNVLCFDGAAGGLNVSPSLALYLKERAPAIAEKVDQELLPKWLRQRGLDAETSIHDLHARSA